MDLCRDCLDFAITISKRAKTWVRPHGFWNEARLRSGFCRLCKMISDYKRDNAAHRMSTLGDQIDLLYFSFEDYTAHRPLSCVLLRTKSMENIMFNVWADHGSLADLCGAVCNKPPLPNDSCSAAFAHINSWIQECLQNHQECKSSISNKIVDDIDGPKLPRRVLDLRCADNTGISLIETQDQRGKYCALSYCWGPPGRNYLLTRKENIKSHFDGIKLDHLPRTLQDAVIITRQIGIRYLWIDSLCIIQGDTADWNTESAKMADVYQNAFLVIGASGAAHPGEGCFSNRRRCPTTVEIPHFSKAGQMMGSIRLSMCLLGGRNPKDGPLMKRAWALQEQRLARRTLYFMPAGISWKCRELQLGERNPLDMSQWPDWNWTLTVFSRCQLTYKEDRLVALDGLGQAVQEASGDKYSFGILESKLPELLLWFIDDDEVDTSEDLVSVPTWCWASKGGSKFFCGGPTDFLGKFIIDNAEITIENAGVLRMKGVLQECKVSDTVIYAQELDSLHPELSTLLERRQDLYHFETVSVSSGCMGFAAFDREFFEIVTVLFLNEVLHNDNIRPEQFLYAVLLLAPNAEMANSFRRVGMGFVNYDSDLGNLSSPCQVVYIV